MKGHSKIELRDVTTGEIQTFENDNIVTNALSEYLKTTGMFDTELFNASPSSRPLWQKLLGGILLFDTELEESSDNILPPPAPAKMIANGTAFYSTSGAVTELGNWNDQESGIQEDGSLKLVWDFGTNQANGTIACACLTSADGGYIGCGNAASKEKYAGVTINGNEIKDYFCTNSHKEMTAQESYVYAMYADYANNCIYYVDKDSIAYNENNAEQHFHTTGKIQIKKYRFGLSAVDVRTLNKVEEPVETYEITIPDVILNYLGTNYNNFAHEITVDENNDVYIIFNKEWRAVVPKNSDFYILKINSIEEGTTTVYHMVNTADYEIYAGYTMWKFSTVFNRYYYTRKTASTTCITRYNLNDSTDVDEIGSTSATQYNHFRILGKNLYYSDDAGLFRVNTESKELEPQNGTRSHTEIEKIQLENASLLYLMCYTQAYSAVNSVYVQRNMLYLATINNLSEPVVKTAEKTMKITYTVTFDD